MSSSLAAEMAELEAAMVDPTMVDPKRAGDKRAIGDRGAMGDLDAIVARYGEVLRALARGLAGDKAG